MVKRKLNIDGGDLQVHHSLEGGFTGAEQYPGGSDGKDCLQQETRVRFLGWEDPGRKRKATWPQYSCLRIQPIFFSSTS